MPWACVGLARVGTDMRPGPRCCSQREKKRDKKRKEAYRVPGIVIDEVVLALGPMFFSSSFFPAMISGTGRLNVKVCLLVRMLPSWWFIARRQALLTMTSNQAPRFGSCHETGTSNHREVRWAAECRETLGRRAKDTLRIKLVLRVGNGAGNLVIYYGTALVIVQSLRKCGTSFFSCPRRRPLGPRRTGGVKAWGFHRQFT